MRTTRRRADARRMDSSVPPAPQGHNNPPPDIRLAVVGSRTFANARLMEKVLSEYVGRIALFISGGADGADRMGARWARGQGLETAIFEPDHKRYKHAYHHRNRLIVEAADLVIAFWNGRSTGTTYTVAYAKKLGKSVRVIRF